MGQGTWPPGRGLGVLCTEAGSVCLCGCVCLCVSEGATEQPSHGGVSV